SAEASTHARLIPERSENRVDASAGVRSSEVALFPAQVQDPSRTRSLIVTKVAPICHRALRSSPLMARLRLIASVASVAGLPLCRLCPPSYTKSSRQPAGQKKLWLR